MWVKRDKIREGELGRERKREEERKREREGERERERGRSVLFARDGRVAIATGGCLLLRPAVVWGGMEESAG